MDRERGWDEVARFWRPPPDDAGPDQIFPQKIGEFRRSGHNGDAEIPELNIRRLPGKHASYLNGSRFVELVMIRATELEKEALFKRALEADHQPPEKPARDRRGARRPGWTYSLRSRRLRRDPANVLPDGAPRSPGHPLVHDKGWLFVVRTEGGGGRPRDVPQDLPRDDHRRQPDALIGPSPEGRRRLVTRQPDHGLGVAEGPRRRHTGALSRTSRSLLPFPLQNASRRASAPSASWMRPPRRSPATWKRPGPRSRPRPGVPPRRSPGRKSAPWARSPPAARPSARP